MAGLAAQRAGDARSAIARLAPWSAKATAALPALPGIEPDEAEVAMRVALAESYTSTEAIAAAQAEWQRLVRLATARPHEVAYARAKLTALTGAPPLPPAISQPSSGLPHPSIVLLAPLSGPAQVLGERLTRAALLAVDPSPNSPDLTLLLRDPTEPDIGVALRGPGVVALAAAGERAAVDLAAQHGLAVIALADLGALPTGTFSIVHGPEARAQALARQALAAGARAFALLGPELPAALRLNEAFRATVLAGGGQVVATATYAPTASSFGAAVAVLKRSSVEAVFVPDDADKLELIAPALAAADLWPRPWPAPPSNPAQEHRRSILLLSTALRPGPALLRNAGRYIQGALFAPGFIAESNNSAIAPFVERYRSSFGQEPSASDAYGYDAVRLLTSAIAAGARTSEAIVAHLAHAAGAPFPGVTGLISFGSDRRRSDPPAIFVVEGDALVRHR